MSYRRAIPYDVPHFDCPYCGEVNGRYGQDALGDEEMCDTCGKVVSIDE